MKVSATPRTMQQLPAIPSRGPQSQTAQEGLNLDHAIALSLAVPGLDQAMLAPKPKALAVPEPARRCTCSFCIPRERTFIGIMPVPAALKGAARTAYILAFVAGDPNKTHMQRHEQALDAVLAHSLRVGTLDYDLIK